MQVYQSVEVTKENAAGVPVGVVGVVVGCNDPVAVKFSDPEGIAADAVVMVDADKLRVL